MLININKFSQLGINVFCFDCIDSTNLQAIRMIDEGKLTEPALIISKKQTAGKGMGNNKWISEPEANLTFSLVLFPTQLLASTQFIISKTITLSICKLLKDLNVIEVSIKWPNDIYVGDNKIAGVLIENSVAGNFLQYSVCGIGININQVVFPGSIPNPTSVKRITGISFELSDILEKWAIIFFELFKKIEKQDLKNIDETYFRMLYRLNERKSYRYKGKVIEASIKGVSAFGELMLMTSDNLMITCGFKEIEFLNNERK